MTEFVFTSPGVKFREKELPFVVSSVGLTNLGLVGETLKGPAFEPVFITDKRDFLNRFGSQSIEKYSNGSLRYQLPFVANSFLEESNQLWVTRVLGLSGYDAGKAWAITLSAGVDPTTVETTASAPLSESFTGGILTIDGVSVAVTSLEDTGVIFTGFTKSGSVFTGTKHTYGVDSISNGSGTVTGTSETITGSSYVDYENVVLAVIRSAGSVVDVANSTPTRNFKTTSVALGTNTTLDDGGDLFGSFVLTATNLTGGTTAYTVSLNKNSSNYITNVLGTQPSNKKELWVEWVTPNSVQYYDKNGVSYDDLQPLSGISSYGFGVNSTLLEIDSDAFSTTYKTEYKTAETPWVVSQVKGSSVERLFRFISISDGNSSNSEIKISIANINPITLEFDVQIRNFYDTDANPEILESYSKCTLIQSSTNYIAKRIGTIDGEYMLNSKYVMVELNSEIQPDSFPAGFEGYMLNNFASSVTGAATDGKEPKVIYKKAYDPNERVNKAYLGISNVVFGGSTIEQNLFNFNGWKNSNSNVETDFVKSKGFHLDVNATGTYYDGVQYIGEFEVGADEIANINDISDETSKYFDIKSRKFTLVPSGGFDGWDIYRTNRTHNDYFRQGGIYDGVEPNEQAINDFQAWETAINTFANPEQVTINLFATPGINWADNTLLVNDTIEMLQTERTDSLYVIDTPDIPITPTVGTTKSDVVAARDIAEMLKTTGIDSNYACTYFPYIQVKDTYNNVNVYIPPTGEVVKAMAYNDNVKAPWWAPAGLNRGVTNALKSKYKLSIEARGILQEERINPMTDFVDVGTAIFGQKTLTTFDGPLNRINVRRLLLHTKVLISNIAIRLLFEQNDLAVIDEFKSKVDPILANIKRERGLHEFGIKMDESLNTPETIDRNELYGEIFLKPTPALEKIGITFVITPMGASFSDLGL